MWLNFKSLSVICKNNCVQYTFLKPMSHKKNDLVQCNTYLLKANIRCILPEALSADIQGIFPDKSMPVATHAAVIKEK